MYIIVHNAEYNFYLFSDWLNLGSFTINYFTCMGKLTSISRKTVEGSCCVYSQILIKDMQHVVGSSGKNHDHIKGNFSSAENRPLDFQHTKQKGNPSKHDLQ
jgi:hypothetical protein